MYEPKTAIPVDRMIQLNERWYTPQSEWWYDNATYADHPERFTPGNYMRRHFKSIREAEKFD